MKIDPCAAYPKGYKIDLTGFGLEDLSKVALLDAAPEHSKTATDLIEYFSRQVSDINCLKLHATLSPVLEAYLYGATRALEKAMDDLRYLIP